MYFTPLLQQGQGIHSSNLLRNYKKNKKKKRKTKSRAFYYSYCTIFFTEAHKGYLQSLFIHIYIFFYKKKRNQKFVIYLQFFFFFVAVAVFAASHIVFGCFKEVQASKVFTEPVTMIVSSIQNQ